MRILARVGLLVGAVCLLGGDAVGQETPEDIRRRREADERNIDRICAPARKEYEARRAQHERFAARMRDPAYQRENTASPEEAQRAIRDSRAQVTEARETYCECLRNNYAKAGQLMPSELERLCRGELETPDPDVMPPPEPPGPRTGYPEAPAGETAAACAREKARYVKARQRDIDAGQPSRGRQAERAFREVPAAGFAYCDCLRRYYQVIPLEVAMFCSSFDEMRTGWGPLGPGVAPPPADKPPKAGRGADPVCAAEFQKYKALYQRLEATPRESPERPELQRTTDAAFNELCECLRVKAPDKWRALCGDPPIPGPATGTPGASGSKPSKPNDPPPPPVAPPAPGGGNTGSTPELPPSPPVPGAGTGSGSGGPGGGAPVPTPTPTPATVPPAVPTEVSVAPWVPQQGMTMALAVAVVRHDGVHTPGAALFHDPERCAELARATLISILTAGADSFSAAIGGQRPLNFTRIGTSNSFRGAGTFGGFPASAGQATIDPFSASNGTAQGRLRVVVPGGEIHYMLNARIQP